MPPPPPVICQHLQVASGVAQTHSPAAPLPPRSTPVLETVDPLNAAQGRACVTLPAFGGPYSYLECSPSYNGVPVPQPGAATRCAVNPAPTRRRRLLDQPECGVGQIQCDLINLESDTSYV